MDIAVGTPLEDPETKSIGVAAADFDADGREEVYIIFSLQIPGNLGYFIAHQLVICLLVLCYNHVY